MAGSHLWIKGGLVTDEPGYRLHVKLRSGDWVFEGPMGWKSLLRAVREWRKLDPHLTLRAVRWEDRRP